MLGDLTSHTLQDSAFLYCASLPFPLSSGLPLGWASPPRIANLKLTTPNQHQSVWRLSVYGWNRRGACASHEWPKPIIRAWEQWGARVGWHFQNLHSASWIDMLLSKWRVTLHHHAHSGKPLGWKFQGHRFPSSMLQKDGQKPRHASLSWVREEWLCVHIAVWSGSMPSTNHSVRRKTHGSPYLQRWISGAFLATTRVFSAGTTSMCSWSECWVRDTEHCRTSVRFISHSETQPCPPTVYAAYMTTPPSGLSSLRRWQWFGSRWTLTTAPLRVQEEGGRCWRQLHVVPMHCLVEGSQQL